MFIIILKIKYRKVRKKFFEQFKQKKKDAKKIFTKIRLNYIRINRLIKKIDKQIK